MDLKEILPKHQAVAEKNGHKIVSGNHVIKTRDDRTDKNGHPLKHRDFRYTFECEHGHQFERFMGRYRIAPACPVCKKNKTADYYAAAALERGFEYVTHYTDNSGPNSQAHVDCRCLECGEVSTFGASNLTRSSVRCRHCEAGGRRNREEASCTYIVKVTMADGQQWVKAGSSRLLQYRLQNIASKNRAAVELVRYTVHPDRPAAYKAEQFFKEQFAAYRIDFDDAVDMGISDGTKEAFQIELLEGLQ